MGIDAGRAVGASTDEAAPLTLRSLAISALVERLVPPANAPELAFLRDRAPSFSGDREKWREALRGCLRAPTAADAPLVRVAAELQLNLLEVLAVALSAAVEDDVLIGRALAYLQTPISASRPTIGLLVEAFPDLAPPGLTPFQALVAGDAVALGLLARSDPQAPLAEQSLFVPLPHYLGLLGRDATWPGALIDLPPSHEVGLPESVLERAARTMASLKGVRQGTMVVRSSSPAEARSVAAAMARSIGRRPLYIEGDALAGLAPWLLLRDLVPVFIYDLGPGQKRTIPLLPGYGGPVLVVAGVDGVVETATGGALSWTLPIPAQEERRALWSRAVGDGELASKLAEDYRHGSGRIAHLGRLALSAARAAGRPKLAPADIATAAWQGENGLGALAQAMPEPISDEALVLSPLLRQDLETLVARCRARDHLVDGLGPSAVTRYRPGVRALFVGPSGTGKTLAAGWLATRLQMPLYRVDLASMISKFIGETEKNLAQLFAIAEHTEVILLFDEADSIFGKRTDVREANDRFANAQTNYVLQRIESFDGIAVLTSNNQSRMDPAFARRLDAILEFPPPGPESRRDLWLAHLGQGHAVERRDVQRLAAIADLGGGHVRNVVLTAAVIARGKGRPIQYGDLVQALATEYRKLGKQLPAELRGALA